MFTVFIIEDYSIHVDIDRHQSVLEPALSKEYFSAGTGIYMLPSNLNLNIGKTVGYNNKILVTKIDMKIGPNKDINKAVVYHKKLPVTTTRSGGAVGAAHAAPKIHLVKSTDKPHNNEKLASTLLILGLGWFLIVFGRP